MPLHRLLVLTSLLFPTVVGAAQQSGHSTVPTSGPAAQGGFTTASRQEDPVLARVEQLCRDLEGVAKRYKKLKAAEKTERQRDLLAALARVEAEVAAAGGQVPAR